MCIKILCFNPILLPIAAGLTLVSLSGCSSSPKPTATKLASNASVKPANPTKLRLIDRGGSGRLAYLGWDVRPKTGAKPGQMIEITHYFKVEQVVARDLSLFVHGERTGGGRVLVNDHLIGGGAQGTASWKKGETWMVRHVFRVPLEATGGQLALFGGLFSGDHRLTVWGAPKSSDGQDRIRLGQLKLAGSGPSPEVTPPKTQAPSLPEVTIRRTKAKIQADGKLDEAAWKTAAILTFSDSMGRNIPTRFKTKLRLLYDPENLYVSFEADHQDISCPYKKRDDPTYDHEAVELFIMPNVRAPNLGPYIELQASPKGIIFDAAFTARRTGMDTSFNAGQTVGTTIDGTLNLDDGKDRGFISEWVVPFAKMRGVKAAPKAGDEWRMNAFRIEKFRQNGQLNGEFTAWSPPMVGDFHHVMKFGRMKFGS